MAVTSDDAVDASRIEMSGRSIFNAKLKPFPAPVDGKIATVQFLEGASALVCVVDEFGKVFAPVRYDMNGNIQKLTTKFNEDSKKFEYLNDMLIYEKAAGELHAAEALLWLRRALHFLHNFLFSLVEDTKANRRPEDLSENIAKAYKETLQIYHGFFARQLFNVLSKMVPTRSKLLKAFTLQGNGSEDAVFEEIESFLLNLNTNLTLLVKFYEEFKLNPPESKDS